MEQYNVSPRVYDHSPQNHHIPFQIKLPLQIGILIHQDDPVWTFNEVMEGVNLAQFLKVSKLGREPYNPFMMLKVILFSEMLGGMSYRELENACKNDIRFMFLAQEQTPSHNTFKNFVNDRLLLNIHEIFLTINEYLIKTNHINMDELYIDGTKVEANANKYTFVWKKVASRTRDRRLSDTLTIFDTLIKDYRFNIIYDELSIEVIDHVVSQIIHRLIEDDIELVYGQGKRKTPLQRLLDKLVNYLYQLYSCIEKITICGEDRNSYSKTDHDATMMHMKEDYYGGTNLFKAGYNVQLGVSDEFIMHASVIQDRNDQKSLIPFLKQYQEMYHLTPEKIVADSGYGSYDNYMYLTLQHRKLYIKFHQYSREKSAKYKRQIYKRNNWKRVKDNQYLCPQNHHTQLINEYENTKGLYTRINFTLSTLKCDKCPVKKMCTDSKGHRNITYNPILEEFQDEVRKNLSGEEGKRLKDNRSYQSEGAFAQLKSKHGKERFRRRGLKSVTLEMLLSCIGYNLMKHHNKKTVH
ncbi:MAG: IS1182 family transposase [Erysipelothrix sp.]|nr:IS1182 family transposase [Erysipelothrix sp.]